MIVEEKIVFESKEACNCIHKYVLKEVIKNKSEECGYRNYTFTKRERYFCEKCLTSKDLIWIDTRQETPNWY